MALKTNLNINTPSRERLAQDIQLISKGYFNRKAFPEGEITVYPWDSSIDSYIVNRSRKKKGNLILDLFPKLCDLNGCPESSFLVGEIDLILLCSRALTNKGSLILKCQCPSCDHTYDENLKVPDDLEVVGQKAIDYTGIDKITLPDCQDVVSISPLNVGTFNSVSTRDDKNVPDQKAFLSAQIIDVGGGAPDNVAQVLAYLDALSPADQAFLAQEADRITPHLNKLVDIECPECGHEYQFPLQFDTNFFRGYVLRQPASAL